MEIKVEATPEPVNWATLCRMCLSTERKTWVVEDVSFAYGVLGGCAPPEGARVCWECRAALTRLQRLRRRAERARDALRACLAHTDTFSGKCLSELTIQRLPSYNIKYKHDEDFTTAPDTDTPELKDEIETDNGNDYVSDCEVWAEAALPSDGDATEFAGKAEEITAAPAEKPEKTSKKVGERKRRKAEQQERKARLTKKPKDDVIEMFVATEAELAAYRENAFSQMKTSKYTCLSCLEGYKYEENLLKHNERFHSEAAGAFVCGVCSSRFPGAAALQQHRSRHRRLFRCLRDGCGFVHPRSRTVRAHHALHDLREKSQAKRRVEEIFRLSDRFECDYCGKVFKQRRQLSVHIKHHFKRVMCEVCGHKCSTLSQLKKHSLAHLDPSYRPFACEQCHKRFIDRHKLLLHTRIHTGERPFKCETCGGEFVSKEVLARHARDRHSDGVTKVRKRFSQARTKSYFINRRYIPGEEERPLRVRSDYKIKDGANTYECSVCEKRLSTLAALRTHFYIHSDKKPLKCDECDKTFKFHSQLQTHVRFLHKGEKPHQCNVCGARFALKATLNVHLSSHSNEKPFKCDQCNVTFKYKAGLWSHKLIHTGEKPHQCTICGSRFTLRGNLVGHMKTHTNERPFECSVCGRKFPWKRNLKNHFKTHTKEQQLLPP